MSKKTGTLIRNARTMAGLTQAQLAKKVDGCTAADISKAERGEKDLTQAQLKQIAKATGVTQNSLLESAKSASSSKPSSGKTSSAKASSSQSLKLTKKEQEMVRKYRKAGIAVQAVVDMILDKTADSDSGKKDDDNILQTLLNAGSGGSSGKKDDLVGNLLNMLGKK